MKFSINSGVFLENVDVCEFRGVKKNILIDALIEDYDDFEFDLRWDFFSFSKRLFYYGYFVKGKLTPLEKITPSHKLDYSGNHFKNKKNFINVILRSSLKGGNKLSMLTHINYFNNSFYYLFNGWNEFLSKKFPSYDVFHEISTQNPRFFNINLLLKSILDLNDSMFNLRVIRYTKSQRKQMKTRKRFFSEVVYLPKHKRTRTILKLIHRHAHQYNSYNYFERLLMSFCDSFFFQKKSFLYQRKIHMYRNAFSNTKQKSLQS